jgi:hypothetical protein
MAGELMSACAPHAAALGCVAQLDLLEDLLDDPSPARQRELAARDGLEGLVADLAIDFTKAVSPIEPGVV